MLHFYKAELADAANISQLVNRAYRGEPSRKGWTTEADLLEGIRTTTADVAAIVNATDQYMLMGVLNDEIVACVHCQKQSYEGEVVAQFGMIAVEPVKQNQGYGKEMIVAAEAMTKREWQVKGYAMLVISQRHDVIHFYAGSGYQPTNTFVDFPVAPEKWQPKVSGLALQYLVKALN